MHAHHDALIARVPKRGVYPSVGLSSYALLLVVRRDSLTQLFIALGLESREAGEDGETGYGIPDRGGEDSEAVIAKVRRRLVLGVLA